MSANPVRPNQIIITGVEEKSEQPNFLADKWAKIEHILQYRDLIHNLVLRDLKVRYRNSALGVLWSLMNPLLMMLVFTLVFTVMAPVRSGELQNFPVFVLCALLPWNFFSQSIIGATGSIVTNGVLLKKVYFPREILPLSMVVANLINFLIALTVLFAMILIFGIPLTVWLVYLPLIILIQVVFTLGIGFIVAAVNVFYRDTQQVIDVLMLAWFFVTPIFYPLDILPRSYVIPGLDYTLNVWRLAYILNPMASLIANYRVVLFDGASPAPDFLIRTAVTSAVVFLAGWLIFNHYSWRFAEEL